jgi:exonuclease III
MEMYAYLSFSLVMVSILSFNANGLRNVNKVQSIFNIINDRHFDIVFLQETFWDLDFINGISHLWEGKILHCCSDNSRAGVAILINKRFENNVEYVYGFNGKFVHASFVYNNVKYNLCNVYAPNCPRERHTFLCDIGRHVSNFDNVILAGDFNATLSILDRDGRTDHQNNLAFKELTAIMENNELHDIWRRRNKGELVFSRKQVVDGILTQSRIDYFLICHNIIPHVQNVFYNDTSFSDHALVVLKLDLDLVERGPGVWILNNCVLLEEEYINKIKALIQKEKQHALYVSETGVWWDNLKYHIKKLSQLYCKDRNKKRFAEYYKLQNQLRTVSRLSAEGVDINMARYEGLKQQLDAYEKEKCNGAILRSKAFWALESDRSTKYFLNLEKYRQERNGISQLSTEDGRVVTDSDSILNEQYLFYSSLYSCVDIDPGNIDSFLQYESSTLNVDNMEHCDKTIECSEIKLAVNSMSKNKSPGQDGLTVEFYCTFYAVLEDVMLRLYKEVEENKQLPLSMRKGVITLIYKKGDKRLLKNWRPISLLNVDYKILARVMSDRLKQVMPSIISPEQSCCVIGRDISDTIASVRDIITLAENENMEGYILKLDQLKAFDRVSHAYLFAVLEKFGFGQRFIDWIKIFYTDIYGSVKCNGHLTRYFPVKNSVRQGCPISAMLYVLVAEPLCKALKANVNITGIHIPCSNRTSLIYQHADDTTLTVSNKVSIVESFKVLDDYGKASGAKVNKSKSEIMCIGSGYLHQRDLDLFGVTICDQVLQLLGVYIGKCQHVCDELNWRELVKKTKQLFGMWSLRRLTIHGRAVVISNLVTSRIWYKVMVQTMPDWALNEIKVACLRFLWAGRAHLVAYQTIIGSKEDGGLQIPDIGLKIKAFRLKYLFRYFDDGCTALWKETCSYFLQSLCGMALTRECFYMSLENKHIQCLPAYYREMFGAWSDVRQDIVFKVDENFVYNQPLFLNRSIQYNGKVILYPEFIKAGVTLVRDITYEVITGFLPPLAVAEMVVQCNPDVSIVQVYTMLQSIIDSLPEQWTHIINTELASSISHVHCELLLSGGRTAIAGTHPSHWYTTLIGKVIRPPAARAYWRSLYTDLVESTLWRVVNFKFKTPECIDLDFRVCHNSIYTNQKLFHIGKVDSALCPVCKLENEVLHHMFVDCVQLTDAKQFIVHTLETLFKDTPHDYVNNLCFKQLLLLGYLENRRDVNFYFVNYFLSIARLCINKRRLIAVHQDKIVPLKPLIIYSLKANIKYAYFYYNHSRQLGYFEKVFVSKNPFVAVVNNSIQCRF